MKHPNDQVNLLIWNRGDRRAPEVIPMTRDQAERTTRAMTQADRCTKDHVHFPFKQCAGSGHTSAIEEVGK